MLDIFSDPVESAARINRDLERIYVWGVFWNVLFNPVKTNYMIVTNRFIAYPTLYLNNIPVNYTNSHSHLVLVLTPSMSWGKHINKCVVKASHRVNLLSRVKYKLPRFSLCSIYKTLVRPIIEYCNVIYDNCTMNESMELEKVQRCAALVCTGAYRHTKTELLLAELGWQPLTVRHKNHKLILLYKIVNGKCPDYLTAILPSCSQCEYNLRSADNATLPTPASHLSSKRKFFVASTIRHWNSLSKPIRSAETLSHFKILLRNKTGSSSPFLPKLYKYMLGKRAINHSRLRLGLSALNFHRFKYNLISDMCCPTCSHPKEDTNHFIFVCPAYATLRVSLLEGLSDLLSTNMYENKTILENVLLYGTVDLHFDTILSVFNLFQKYIHESGRFW